MSDHELRRINSTLTAIWVSLALIAAGSVGTCAGSMAPHKCECRCGSAR